MTFQLIGIILKASVVGGGKRMRAEPKAFERYRHFKGNIYQILNLAKDSETMEDVVVYQALYGDYQVYVRPLEMFMSEIDKEKYPNVKGTYRFEKLDTKMEMDTDTVSQEQDVVKEVEKNQDKIEKEECGIDPSVMEFLDADNYGQKLNILVSLRHRITDDMITTMAVASDIEVEDGPVAERYEQLKNCLLTKEKYECVRIR